MLTYIPQQKNSTAKTNEARVLSDFDKDIIIHLTKINNSVRRKSLKNPPNLFLIHF